MVLKYNKLQNRHKADPLGIGGLYGRASEHAAKLALVHAISIDGAGTRSVTEQSILWAWGLVEYLIENTIYFIRSSIHDNDASKLQQKVCSKIEQMNTLKLPVYKRDLMRTVLRGLSSREVDVLLGTMVEAETIGVEQVNKRNAYYLSQLSQTVTPQNATTLLSDSKYLS